MVAVRAVTASELPTIRRAQSADAEVCGSICYEAFTTLNKKFNFPPDFPSQEVAQGVLSSMFGNRALYDCGHRPHHSRSLCSKQDRGEAVDARGDGPGC